MTNWPGFKGYGPLPGIQRAEYERRTDTMVGSRIHVYNEDGSEHFEEIVEWEPEYRVVMQLSDFTPPFSRLATHVIEAWHFEASEGGTLVTRAFQMFPKNMATRPALWLISLLFRRAIAQHLDEMAR